MGCSRWEAGRPPGAMGPLPGPWPKQGLLPGGSWFSGPAQAWVHPAVPEMHPRGSRGACVFFYTQSKVLLEKQALQARAAQQERGSL